MQNSLIILGQEIPPCFGRRGCKMPNEDHQKDGKEENYQEIKG
jgi:hypothetical protein